MVVNLHSAFEHGMEACLPESELILSRIRTLCQRRLLWLRQLQENAKSTADTRTALDSVLLDHDCPTLEGEFYANDRVAASLGRHAQYLADKLAALDEGRLSQLVQVLGITARESDLLQICLASSIDPELSGVYGVLSGSEGRAAPTESLAARICGHGRNILMTPMGGLTAWKIILAEQQEAADPPTLRIDSHIRAFLLGNDELDPLLSAFCIAGQAVYPPLPGWPVNDVAQRIKESFTRNVPSLVQVMAMPLSGRRSFAACVARMLGSTLICVDTSKIPESQWDEARLRVQRQALLRSCAVCWYGNNAVRGPVNGSRVLPLEFTVLESSAELGNALGWHEERIQLPPLSSSVRRQLWLRMLPVASTWSSSQLTHLARRYGISVGEIAHVATQGETEFDKVCALTRELSRGKLGELAQLIDCPFVRDDLQVPAVIDQQIDEFMFEASERVGFWEQPAARRLFPRGTGLIGLLAGPPGTGKTMAAQIIAAELGLDLFRIDLATTVNKYIGETAKNLRRLFNRAACMNAVLLFDEADALFAKRTNVRDSHDRYANSDTNYLLQLVEDYPGVALLATNKRQQLDDAFVRRVRYTFYFPRPDAAQRLCIWKHAITQLSSTECAQRMATDLEQLAVQINVTGAQIKNAVLAGVFLSRRRRRLMTIEDLRIGLEKQLSDHGSGPTVERVV